MSEKMHLSRIQALILQVRAIQEWAALALSLPLIKMHHPFEHLITECTTATRYPN
jgi:hypothetical protein